MRSMRWCGTARQGTSGQPLEQHPDRVDDPGHEVLRGEPGQARREHIAAIGDELCALERRAIPRRMIRADRFRR